MKPIFDGCLSFVIVAAETSLATTSRARNTEPGPWSAMTASQSAAAFRVPRVFGSRSRLRARRAKPIAMARGHARETLGCGELYYAERTQRFDLRLRDRGSSIFFEGCRWRRGLRSAHGLQRRHSDADQPGAGPRGRLAPLPAAVALHPGPRRRRCARCRGRSRARRIHGARRKLSQLRQRSEMGPRWLALRTLRAHRLPPTRGSEELPRRTASR